MRSHDIPVVVAVPAPQWTLPAERIINFAIDHGWLDLDAVVDGDVVVIARMLRHRSYTLEQANGRGLFVKQLADASREAVVGFNREVRLHHAVHAGTLAELSGLIPGFVGIDEQRAVLALDRVSGVSLRERPLHGVGTHGAAAGRIFARLHRLDTGEVESALDGLLEREIPWAFDLPRQLARDMPTLHRASQQLAQALAAAPDAAALMARLAEQWRHSGPMHADAKWDNILADADNPECTWLIDWETIDIGDPAWDVATFLQSAVVQVCIDDQLASVPTAAHLAPHRPAQTEFWQTWAETFELAPGDVAEEQLRVAGYAGVRLVLSAYSETLIESELSYPTQGMLAAGLALLRNPARAGAELLGLEAS